MDGTAKGGGAAVPRVSVVVPMYNAASTIERTLRSAQSQTERAIEIIVVDDGSTDRGPDIVRAMIAQDPRIILHVQPNAGVAAARNLAIGHARGTFIAPLDADDIWLPRKIARQLEAFDRSGPGTALVYCFFDAIDPRDRLLWHGPRERIDGPALDLLLARDVVGNGSNALMRTDLVRQVGGYDASLRQAGGQGAEDWQIALRLAELGAIACVPEVLLGYRRTRGNMSGDSVQMLRSARLVAEPFRRRYPDLASCIEGHMADRRRWLLARAMGEANLRGMAAMGRDVGSRRKAALLMASVAAPVTRQLASSLVHRLGFRQRRAFGAALGEMVVDQQFSHALASVGGGAAQPVADHAPGDPTKANG